MWSSFVLKHHHCNRSKGPLSQVEFVVKGHKNSKLCNMEYTTFFKKNLLVLLFYRASMFLVLTHFEQVLIFFSISASISLQILFLLKKRNVPHEFFVFASIDEITWFLSFSTFVILQNLRADANCFPTGNLSAILAAADSFGFRVPQCWSGHHFVINGDMERCQKAIWVIYFTCKSKMEIKKHQIGTGVLTL